MKKRKLKKNIKILFTLIIIIVICIIVKLLYSKTIDNNNNKYEYQDKIVNNTDQELNEDVKKLIVDFFNVYYRSMKELTLYETDDFFTIDSQDKLLYKTALELLIESRKKQLNDLTLKKVKYDLTINKIKTKNDVINIELNEDTDLDFTFLDFTSKVYNVLNKFEIVKENDKYKIKSFNKEQGFFIMVQYLIDEDNNYEDEINRIKKYYSDIFDNKLEEQNKLYQDYLSNKNKTFKTCDNKYDRQKAVDYALKYVTQRNSEIINYDGYGGNCQNYASWSLNNGGIPMDTKGTSQWKHYSGEINEKNLPVGRSTSWTGVPQFYAYAKSNTGYGLCSEVDVNPYYAQKGDIVQVGYSNKFRHSTLVIDTFKKDDNVVDVILISNTGDLEYFPLSAYVYPEKRLIKILGWNN